MNAGTTRKKKIAVVVLLALLVIIPVVRFLTKGSDTPSVREHIVKKGDIEITVLATGVVEPENRVAIKPPINGRVERILVKEGDRVRKGQILAYMSSTERAALLDAARAKGAEEVKTWEDMYKPTPIVAPISGTIIQRNLESGQSFTSADAVLVMSDRLTVKAQVDETDIASIKVKQTALITLDAYSAQPLQAVVQQIAFDAKTVNNVTTYEIDVLPVETPEFMRSGMTANVVFDIRATRAVLVVPNSAVRSKDGAVFITVREKGKDVERAVTIGAGDNKFAEVVSGLQENEIVMVPEYRVGDGKKSRGGPFAPPGNRRARGH